MAEESNNSDMKELSAMRANVLSELSLEETAAPTPTEAPLPSEAAELPSEPELLASEGTPGPTEGPTASATEAAPGEAATLTPQENPASGTPAADALLTSPTPDSSFFLLDSLPILTPTPKPTPTPTPTPRPTPSPTPDWTIRTGALAYTAKEKVELSEDDILPELKEIYALNNDLIGWIVIPGTIVDYPVMQTEENDYYLHRDFYGEENANGQIMLDNKCDPYTPSYNLVISGHHMNNGSMFGGLTKYAKESYWREHRFVEFDTLVARKQYVIFGAFYSADYDENEEGFRYYADLRYKLEADRWLKEIEENKIYDTGIEVEFGDEFLTLTTCDRSLRRDGRFVLVCRRIREGETFE